MTRFVDMTDAQKRAFQGRQDVKRVQSVKANESTVRAEFAALIARRADKAANGRATGPIDNEIEAMRVMYARYGLRLA